MDLRRASLLITTLLLAAGPAAGQGFQPMPSQGFGPPPGAVRPAAPNPFDAAPPQEPPCFKEFLELKAETEKRGKAVQVAGQRKVHPAEACKLFNSLMAAEVKFIKFVDENVKSCGIPPQVPVQLKENHTKVKQVRDRVCQIAQRPARPAGPSLSDALGTSHLPDSSNIKTGRGGGTFDTLTNTTPQR
jgi:hypothetical protein